MFLLSLPGIVLLVGVGLASGIIPSSRGGDSARPPCERLPAKALVIDAVSSHKDLDTQIRNVGPGVRVVVATPCQGQPDKALVSVKYATDSERSGVDAILRQGSFGVPVELVHR